MPRQQTLRATLNWSYELHSRAEQIALRRLAVFTGPFDARSASAVIADNDVHAANVLDVLTSLAAKSLVAALVAGEQVCYRLLDTSRVYALEKLAESHERDEIKRRHALLCCSWGKGDPDWELQGVREKIAGSRQRVDDVRAALDWCFSPQGDSSLGVNLTADSASIWFRSSALAAVLAVLGPLLRAGARTALWREESRLARAAGSNVHTDLPGDFGELGRRTGDR